MDSKGVWPKLPQGQNLPHSISEMPNYNPKGAQRQWEIRPAIENIKESRRRSDSIRRSTCRSCKEDQAAAAAIRKPTKVMVGEMYKSAVSHTKNWFYIQVVQHPKSLLYMWEQAGGRLGEGVKSNKTWSTSSAYMSAKEIHPTASHWGIPPLKKCWPRDPSITFIQIQEHRYQAAQITESLSCSRKSQSNIISIQKQASHLSENSSFKRKLFLLLEMISNILALSSFDAMSKSPHFKSISTLLCFGTKDIYPAGMIESVGGWRGSLTLAKIHTFL